MFTKIFTIILVLLYSSVPVQGCLLSSQAGNCCTTDILEKNNCCSGCEKTCAKKDHPNQKDPITTVNNNLLKQILRIENSPAKSGIYPSIAELAAEKVPDNFAGENNFEMSLTVTRLLIPLRI